MDLSVSNTYREDKDYKDDDDDQKISEEEYDDVTDNDNILQTKPTPEPSNLPTEQDSHSGVFVKLESSD